MQRLRANDVWDLVRLDGADRSGTEHIDHIAGEDFTGFDITRRAQAATLDDGGFLFVTCNEFIRRAKERSKSRLFDHPGPFVGSIANLWSGPSRSLLSVK